MNTCTRFYRFFYWSFTLTIVIALIIVLKQLLWGADSEEIASIYIAFYLLAGISLLSLIGYVLAYGKTWAQMGNDNFYVVVFPSYPLDPELRWLFEQAHLKLLDYSNLLSWETASDGMHPDGKSYRQVGKKLASDVNRMLNQ